MLKEIIAVRVMRAHTEIKPHQGVVKRVKELISMGGVPILYADHEGHFDGAAIAAIAGYTRKLSGGSIRGYATLLAASMEDGHQGAQLKSTYDLLVGGARRMGVRTVSSTRIKDVVQYGMSREHMVGEVRPFIRALREGYGIASLPEGTVQGGRHPEGASIEAIYGMREVNNNNLIELFNLARRVLEQKGKWPFYWPASLYGSFKIMQAPEGGKPTLTERGKWSLIMGVLGLSLVRIQAGLLMPFTEEEIANDLGANWMDDSPSFNRYAMKKLKTGLPPVAWGVYGEAGSQVSEAIELSASY